jgi:hypothetical protein
MELSGIAGRPRINENYTNSKPVEIVTDRYEQQILTSQAHAHNVQPMPN